MLLHLTHIIFEIGLAIVLAVMSGYATHASLDLTDDDSESKTAHKVLTASSIIGWVTVAVTVASVIAMIVFPEEIMASAWLRRIASGMMYVVLFATLIVGILMAYAATLIKKSKDYSHNKQEYTFASEGAIIGLVFSGALLFGFIAMQVYDYYKHGSHGRVGAQGMDASGLLHAGLSMGGYSKGSSMLDTGMELASSLGYM